MVIGKTMQLAAEPLRSSAFARFGSVVSCDRDDRPAGPANLGSADRRDFLADLENLRPAARLNLASFRCRPWAPGPSRSLSLTMLEKHPASAQMFVPMGSMAGASRYLVVVAEGASDPDLASARAFIVSGAQGVVYAPGVWHHPMIALDREIDFACLVWEDGSSLDCVTCALDSPLVVDGL